MARPLPGVVLELASRFTHPCRPDSTLFYIIVNLIRAELNLLCTIQFYIITSQSETKEFFFAHQTNYLDRRDLLSRYFYISRGKLLDNLIINIFIECYL